MVRPSPWLAMMTMVLSAAFAAEPLSPHDARIVAGGGNAAPQGQAATQARLIVPFGVAVDRNRNLYIAEFDGGRVHRVKPDGTIQTMAGDGSKDYTGDGGPAAQATFNGIHNVAATPEGDLYIADTWNCVVRKIDGRTGIISTVAGNGKKSYGGDGGPATAASFNGVFCVSLTPANDALLIVDLGNKRIRRLDLQSGTLDTVAGNGEKGVPKDGAPAAQSPLVDPRAVAADAAGNIWVLERGGHALRVVRPDGTIHTVAGTGKKGRRDGPALQAQLNGPKHLCVDPDDGSVIIADAENHLIRRYDPKMKRLTTLLDAGPSQERGGDPLSLKRPHGVCALAGGDLYVVDSYHHRVLLIRRK